MYLILSIGKKAGLEEIRCEAKPARLNSNEARFRLRDCK